MAKILIVDDSETMRADLAELIENMGHEVIAGADGSEGLRLAQEHPDCALIISDLNMPVMDGLSMCTALRKIPGFESKKIFMLTTEVSPELKVVAKGIGIVAWLLKPLDRARFTAAIEKILAMSA
jgi:two-component system, chemotaxis family, chemotaxis protein CheY